MRLFASGVLVATSFLPAAAALPGGANELHETYQDWQVNCISDDKGDQCVMSQRQVDSASGDTVFSVELIAGEDGGLLGLIVMPFGLAVAEPLFLSLDEKAAEQQLEFSTCLPRGCLVEINLDREIVDGMKSGSSLTVTGAVANSDKKVPFAASLQGFSAAFKRLNDLAEVE
nr:invasion associated locus B family protein [Martelella limonii]